MFRSEIERRDATANSPTVCPNSARVVSRASKDGRTVLRLDNGEQRKYRRFTPVTKGDCLRFEGEKKAWVQLPKMGGEVQITPAWRSRRNLSINGKRIPVVFKEIETQAELDAYHLLTRFHYRGNGGACRRVPLIAKVNVWNLPNVVGFVELSSSLLVNVARKKILDLPYHDSELDISWNRWDWETSKKYTNAIVRISRCVVYPELRGAGMSPMLAEAAVRYAKQRWHIGGLRPCFIEIVAEMLRYWPFVEKAGFVKVGETEGNEKRARKAMEYLLKRKADGRGYPKGGGGIMTMHRMHAEKLDEIQKKKGVPVSKILRLLETSPDRLGVRDWISLHDIFRCKKPTYMRGLTQSAVTHLNKHSEPPAQNQVTTNNCRGRLVAVYGLGITAYAKPKNSKRCRRVQEAFGIVSDKFSRDIVNNLDVEFASGKITLVSGSSGVGKSMLLRVLRHAMKSKEKNFRLSDEIDVYWNEASGKVRIAQLQTPPRMKAPIELLKNHDLNSAMRILAQAGLAEPHLFVRPSYTLSVGQSYRLALALALAKNPDVLLIDEFCEPLDEYTSAVICRRLRRAADATGVGVIVATADARKVLRELQPDRALLMLSSGQHNWLDAKKIRSLP